MWLTPGIQKTDQIQPNITVAPTRYPLGGSTLRDLTKDYVLFDPVVFTVAFPQTDIDVISEAMRTIQLPTQHQVVLVDRPIARYGTAPTTEIPGNMLVLIPQHEWPRVLEFIQAMMFMAENHTWVRLYTRTIDIIDPQIRDKSKVVELADMLVPVVTLVLDGGSTAVVGFPNDKAMPTMIRYRHVQMPADTSTQLLRDAIIDGDTDPYSRLKEHNATETEDT